MNDRDVRSCPWTEQAVSGALHALEPDEEMAVLLHLPQCESCQKAARDVEEVMSSLGASVEQVDPPTSLRDALLSRAAETPQRSAIQHPRTSLEVVRPAVTPAATSAPRHRAEDRGTVHPDDSRPSHGSWLSRRGRRLVAASLALVGVLAIGGLAARTVQLEQQRNAETAQAQSIANLVDQLDRPGVQHALLAADDGSTVAAVVVADGQRQVFPIGLPANAADRDTYVLWGIRAGADPQALGTFDVTAADPGERTAGSAADTEGFGIFAISLEPGRTAPTAPSSVVAKGPVEA